MSDDAAGASIDISVDTTSPPPSPVETQPEIPAETSEPVASSTPPETPGVAPPIPPAPPAPVPASSAPWVVQMTYDMLRDLAARGRAAVQIRKKAKFEKILKYLDQHGKVTNHEVAKFLYVSDDTAWRYLEQLEKEGKLKQVGQTGHAVYYTRP